jgi:glycosyltransferase involved in cell wall biosynthesis
LLLLLPQLIIHHLSDQGRKILFISLTRTGSTAYASAMAQYISSEEAIIITSKEAQKDFKRVDRTISTYSGKLSFVLNSIIFFFKASSLLKEYNDSEKVIVYLPVFHPWNLIIAIWAGVLGITVVTTIHDYKTHIGEKNRLTELIQRLQISVSDKVVFLTEHQKELAASDIPNKSENFTVIPHPILPTGTVHDLEHSEQMKFLLVGRMKKYKGYEIVIKAAESDAIHDVTIAGSGDSMEISNPKITYINRHMSGSELSDLLSTHHVLLLPYKETSQSGIVTLGIDAGIPMIISKLPGLEEQLDEKCGLWIEPNAPELLQAMIDIQNNKKLYDTLKVELKNYKSKYEKDFEEKLQQLLIDLHRL